MNDLIHDIAESLTSGFQPLTIVYNLDRQLAKSAVCMQLQMACGCDVVVGSALALRIHYELNLRRNPEKRAIYIVTEGEVLPDIAVKANLRTFRITECFPNFADKQTLSGLDFDVLTRLYDRHIQGFVSADRLQSILNSMSAVNVAEPIEDIGEPAQLFNEIDNPDWSDINTIRRVSDLFIKAVDKGQYKEIADRLDWLNFDFQHYLSDTYWNKINANPYICPGCVNGVVPHIRDNYSSTDRIALVVVDGMAFWQYEVLRRELEEIRIHPKDEQWIFSWIPSITSLSRQAIFRGATPLIDYTQSPSAERLLWHSHWPKGQFTPQYFYDGECMKSAPSCRRLALVTVELDEKMHSSTSYLDLLALTRIWANNFAQTIAKLKQSGFEIILTTDHGNVLAKGWRTFTASEKAHLYGKMSRGHRHAIFMNHEASEDFKKALGYEVSCMHRDNWFAIRDTHSFSQTGRIEITHGGTHLFEVMIPFIKI